MNAIEENAFSRTWAQIGNSHPRPKAIVCISAHWETTGTRITAMPQPETLYDFAGFPTLLYEMKYPSPGDPDLARKIKQDVAGTTIHLDFNWGLDHGAWSVLCHMYPKADIPVLQLSLDFDQPPAVHYQLGKRLSYLRSEGVLILGSGNMVHNLRAMKRQDTAYDWAEEFDSRLTELIRTGDHRPLIDYPTIPGRPELAIPTNEHYLPMLYILAAQEKTDRLRFHNEKITLGSISMRSFTISS